MIAPRRQGCASTPRMTDFDLTAQQEHNRDTYGW